MQNHKKIILLISISVILLLTNVATAFAQPGPPNPNGGGNNGLPVGGEANLDISLYIWLLPIVIYMFYKLVGQMHYLYKTKEV